MEFGRRLIKSTESVPKTKGAQAPTSELHITGIDRANKGKWVAASRLAGGSLADWAIEKLNDAANKELTGQPPPKWTRALTGRTAKCLLDAGFVSKKTVRVAFNNPEFSWLSIPNFGPKCNEEVLKWLAK